MGITNYPITKEHDVTKEHVIAKEHEYKFDVKVRESWNDSRPIIQWGYCR
jgi:hypothetical protein